MSFLSIDAARVDVRRVAGLLADRLPDPLRRLWAVAYSYWWIWQTYGPAMFAAAIDSARWERCGHNPVRLLREAPVASLQAAAGDSNLVAAVKRLARSRARRHSGLLRPRARRAPRVCGDGETVSADPRTQVAVLRMLRTYVERIYAM